MSGMMHPSMAHVSHNLGSLGYGGLESAWGMAEAATYAEATDSKGNLYFVYSDGKIILTTSVSGKGNGTVWRVGGGTVAGTTYEKILAHLKSQSPQQTIDIEIIMGGGAVATTGANQGTGGVVTWLTGLFSKASTPEERDQALRNLEGAANQYGPGIIGAVQTLLGSQGSSLASLQKQLAKKKAQYATTTNPRKKLQLKYEIDALEQQIAQYQSAAQAAQAQLVAPSQESKPQRWWIPLAIVGGVGLLGIIILSARR